MSEMDWFVGIDWSEQLFEILYHHEGVVISLEEPVKLLPVVFVAVLEASFSFPPQFLSPLGDVESHGTQVRVLLGAHEEEFVTVGAPGVLDVDCLHS